MTLQTDKPGRASDFRGKATQGVALAALVLLTPFSLNNFYQGRYILGAGSLAIVAILAASAWGVSRGRDYSSLTLLGLVPAVVFFLAFALRKQGIIGALWCYPAVISFYFMLPERKAWIANAVLLAVALPQAWGALEAPLAARVAATLLAVSAFSAIFVRVIIDQQRRLEAQAITDPLTGLSNRTTLRAALEQAIQQSSRTRTPMTLVALDLDRFKSINDSLGHDAGDSVLRAVGDLLHRRIRRADKVFRLGGEEFLALLYGTNEENGRRVAEELRGAVASLALLPDRPVTVSIGVATLRPDESWIEWMKRSDENLYRAKASGRDRVAA
ncbi:MAG: GGDEF domain-containing protein [Betaproteobacteria bacterium]|jgi:diguanylate cyclase (GGDEF)-like protein|nr:GGDEF domain-containing protein [Betaproteobacteria bacterium]